uniref:Epsin-1-like n=1 Tax=Phallusia mammillata TaxID=59560 RepID=A0A6F9DCW5_9ASCI|nr:epsin-1-like [Phallusia mammillata]
MAKELKDGISRELRYMEYKLRKKRSDKDKDKKKIKHNQFGKGYPSMDEFSSSSVSTDMKQAMPSTVGEEDLQLQVALAVSREEAKEKERLEKNDKVKLEIAIKESSTQQADKSTPQHQAKPMDPWGGESPTVQAPKNSFDPFSDMGTAQQPSNGIDAWGTTNASNNVAAQPNGSQWSPPKNAALVLPPPQKVAAKPLDPWGPSSPTAVSKPQAPADPWGGNLESQSSSQTAWDAQPQTAPQPSFPSTTGGSFDAFAPTTSTSGFESNGSFDPLKEFDSLHISSTAPPQNIPSFTPMVPTSTSDNFLQQSNGFDENDNQPDGPDVVTNKAGAFLGENAALVNVENLVAKPKTATHYQTLSIDTSGALGSHRNPFNQKGPSPSLNQMKGGPQFGSQMPVTGQPMPGSAQQMPMMNPTPMSMAPVGYGMAPNPIQPVQPVYGMQQQMMYNPNQMNAFPQQNPSLF